MLQACCGDIEVIQVFTPNLGFWDIILFKLYKFNACTSTQNLSIKNWKGVTGKKRSKYTWEESLGFYTSNDFFVEASIYSDFFTQWSILSRPGSTSRRISKSSTVGCYHDLQPYFQHYSLAAHDDPGVCSGCPSSSGNIAWAYHDFQLFVIPHDTLVSLKSRFSVVFSERHKQDSRSLLSLQTSWLQMTFLQTITKVTKES